MSEKPIALGRTAEIFEWQDGQILKLYRAGCPPRLIDEETQRTRAVQAAGLPVPAVLDVIEKDGRRGIVFERITGPSLLADFGAKPWHLIRAARLLAELHAAMHEREVSDLPPLRDSLVYRVENSRVSAATKSRALNVLAQLPEGHAVCHGDFHPDNVILSPRGPVIIDWMTATGGHPSADVTRTSLILRLASPPPGLARTLFAVVRDLFQAQYLKHYQQLRHVTREDSERWLLPVAVARTLEDIPTERQSLAALSDALMSRVQSN